MSEWTYLTYAAWTIAVIAGAVLSFHSLRSWSRSRSRPMLLLAVGVLLLSVAAAVAWVIGYDLTDNPDAPSMMSAAFSAAGFLVLIYAMRTRAP